MEFLRQNSSGPSEPELRKSYEIVRLFTCCPGFPLQRICAAPSVLKQEISPSDGVPVSGNTMDAEEQPHHRKAVRIIYAGLSP